MVLDNNLILIWLHQIQKMQNCAYLKKKKIMQSKGITHTVRFIFPKLISLALVSIVKCFVPVAKFLISFSAVSFLDLWLLAADFFRTNFCRLRLKQDVDRIKDVSGWKVSVWISVHHIHHHNRPHEALLSEIEEPVKCLKNKTKTLVLAMGQ